MRALAWAALLALAGCHDDFASLFSGTAAVDGGVDATAPSLDAATTTSDGGACLTPAVCADNQCDQDGCTYACTGCGCVCPAFQCGRNGGGGGSPRRCDATCTAQTNCDVSCNVDGPCNLAAHGASAKLSCQKPAKSCNVACDQGADCDMACNGEGTCAVTCAADSSCLLDCGPGTTSCDLRCVGGTTQPCGDGVLACRHACR